MPTEEFTREFNEHTNVSCLATDNSLLEGKKCICESARVRGAQEVSHRKFVEFTNGKQFVNADLTVLYRNGTTYRYIFRKLQILGCLKREIFVRALEIHL